MREKFKYIQQTLYVVVPEYIAGFSIFLILIFFSKSYSLAFIGDFTFSNTIAQLIAAIYGSAMLITMRRDFMLVPKLIDKTVITIVFFRLLIVVAIALIVYLLFKSNLISIISFIIIISRLIDSLTEVNHYALLAQNKFNYFSILKSLQYLTLIGCVFIISFFKYDAQTTINFFLINSLFWLFINLVFLKFSNIDFQIDLKNRYLKLLILRTFPLLLSSSIYLLSTRINLLVVKDYCEADEFGVFSILINLIALFSIFASALSSMLMNQQTILYKKSTLLFRNNILKLVLVFLVIGLLFSFSFYYLADYINILFKNYPTDKIYLIKIAAFSVIPLFAQIPLNYIFTIINKNKIALIFSSIMLFCSYFIYSIFSHFFKLDGAVYSLIVYNVFWFLCLFVLSIYLLSKSELK